jgi:hypothetical protein
MVSTNSDHIVYPASRSSSSSFIASTRANTPPQTLVSSRHTRLLLDIQSPLDTCLLLTQPLKASSARKTLQIASHHATRAIQIQSITVLIAHQPFPVSRSLVFFSFPFQFHSSYIHNCLPLVGPLITDFKSVDCPCRLTSDVQRLRFFFFSDPISLH